MGLTDELKGCRVYFDSNSSVAAGIEQLMQDERERDEALDALSTAIRDRLATPDKDWKGGVDDLFTEMRRNLVATTPVTAGNTLPDGGPETAS